MGARKRAGHGGVQNSFSRAKLSGICITGVGRPKKVKLFYHLENIE
jgi:hypothetical protein